MSWLSYLNLSNLASAIGSLFSETPVAAPEITYLPEATFATTLPQTLETLAPAATGSILSAGLYYGILAVGVGVAGYAVYRAIQHDFYQDDRSSYSADHEAYARSYDAYYYTPHYKPMTEPVYYQKQPHPLYYQAAVELEQKFGRTRSPQIYTPARHLFDSEDRLRERGRAESPHIPPVREAETPRAIEPQVPAPIVFPEFRSPDINALPMPEFTEPTVFPDWMDWEPTVEHVVEESISDPMEVDEPGFRFR